MIGMKTFGRRPLWIKPWHALIISLVIWIKNKNAPSEKLRSSYKIRRVFFLQIQIHKLPFCLHPKKVFLVCNLKKKIKFSNIKGYIFFQVENLRGHPKKLKSFYRFQVGSIALYVYKYTYFTEKSASEVIDWL